MGPRCAGSARCARPWPRSQTSRIRKSSPSLRVEGHRRSPRTSCRPPPMRRARSQTPPPRCVSRGPIFSLDAFLTRRFRAAGCHHGDPARPLGRVLRDPQRHRHAIRAIPDRPEFASRSDPTLAPARRSDGRIRDRFRLHDRALSPSPEPAGLLTEGRGPPRAVEEVRREAGRGGHLAGATGTPRQPRAPISWTGSEWDQRSTHTTREEGIRKQRPTRGIRPHEHGEGPVALRTPPGERTTTGRTPFPRRPIRRPP